MVDVPTDYGSDAQNLGWTRRRVTRSKKLHEPMAFVRRFHRRITHRSVSTYLHTSITLYGPICLIRVYRIQNQDLTYTVIVEYISSVGLALSWQRKGNNPQNAV